MRINFTAFMNAFIFLTWLTLIYSIFYDYINIKYWRIIIWVSLLFISIGFYFWMSHLLNITNFIISLTIVANILGEVFFEFYYTIPLYDKILHFTIPFCIVFIGYDVFRPYIEDKKKRLFYAIFTTLSLVLFWEVVEIAFDYFFDAPMIGVFVRGQVPDSIINSIEIMNPIMDTIYDIILDFVGVFLAYLFIIKRIVYRISLSQKIS